MQSDLEDGSQQDFYREAQCNRLRMSFWLLASILVYPINKHDDCKGWIVSVHRIT